MTSEEKLEQSEIVKDKGTKYFKVKNLVMLIILQNIKVIYYIILNLGILLHYFS